MKRFYATLSISNQFKPEAISPGVQYSASFYATREQAVDAAEAFARGGGGYTVVLFEATSVFRVKPTPVVVERVEVDV